VLLGLVFAMLCLLNRWYTNSDFWKYHNKDIAKFASVPGRLQLANLGSSHGTESFEYRDIPYRAFNLALGSQLYIYDYAVLKQYIDHFDRDAVCIILIEYFEITGIKKDFSALIMRYYRFLDKRNMPEYTFSDYLRYALFPVLSLGDTAINGGRRFINANEENRKKTMTIPELEIACNKRYIYLKGDAKNSFVVESGEEGFAYNQAWLGKIIDLCLSHGIQPVLVSTPITSILNGIYAEKSPEFFDTFYRFSREICRKYPMVPYFDYSHDPRFCDDFSLFADGDHLNLYGAEQFTPVVVQDLIAAGLLPPGEAGRP
jgi:hypothetical protein